MSNRALNIVWQSAAIATPSEMLVAVALADMADDDGCCFPSVPTIARRTRMSERNVRYMLANLRDRQLVSWTESRGRGHSNEYRLHLENLQSLQVLAEEGEKVKPAKGGIKPASSDTKAATVAGFTESGETKPAKSAGENLQSAQLKPATVAPQPIREPEELEPKTPSSAKEVISNSAPAREGGGTAAAAAEAEAEAEAEEAVPVRIGDGVKVPVTDDERANLTAIMQDKRRSLRRLRSKGEVPIETLVFAYFGRHARGGEISLLAELDRTYARDWIETALAGAISNGRDRLSSVRRWLETFAGRIDRPGDHGASQPLPFAEAPPPATPAILKPTGGTDPPPRDSLTERLLKAECDTYQLDAGLFERIETSEGPRWMPTPKSDAAKREAKKRILAETTGTPPMTVVRAA